MNTTQSKKSGKGLSHGVVSELSVFFQVRPGHEEDMRAACERFSQWLHSMGPDVHLKIGLREWRHVIFDEGTRLLLITSFETDWDPYTDDAIQVFGVNQLVDWLRYTVEAAKLDTPAMQAAIAAANQGAVNSAALKALLQSGQVQATTYYDVLSDQTVPQIRKAQRLERTFDQLLDDPAAQQALGQLALQPLLEQAAS